MGFGGFTGGKGLAIFSQRLAPFYTGVVATRCTAGGGESFKQTMSRCKHTARDNLSGFQMLLTGWLVSGSTESNCQADITYTAAIEYPAGVFTQVTFSASASGVCTAGANLISDAIALSIPNGVDFYSRVYATTTAGGCPLADGGSASAGDACHIGNTGISDQTMGGTIVSNTLPNVIKPVIIGRTRKASVAFFTDSIGSAGVGDTADATGFIGLLERPLGPSLPFLQLGHSGASQNNFSTTWPKRTALANQYCSHAVSQLGTNSVAQTLSAALASLNSMFAAFTIPIYQCTITPQSTGAWTLADGSDQTVRQFSGSTGSSIDFNAAIRAGRPGMKGYIDIGPLFNLAASPGKWNADGTVSKWTNNDGLHPSTYAYLQALASGIITPSIFKR